MYAHVEESQVIILIKVDNQYIYIVYSVVIVSLFEITQKIYITKFIASLVVFLNKAFFKEIKIIYFIEKNVFSFLITFFMIEQATNKAFYKKKSTYLKYSL